MKTPLYKNKKILIPIILLLIVGVIVAIYYLKPQFSYFFTNPINNIIPSIENFVFVDNSSLTQTLYDCGILNTTDAVYTMNQSIKGANTCINITANNITLDCHGFTINYSSSAIGYGIYERGVNDSTIKNCYITDRVTTNSKHSIHLFNSNNVTIQNNTILTFGQDDIGIYLESGCDSVNTIDNKIETRGTSAQGIYSDTGAAGKFNTFFNNTIYVRGTDAAGFYIDAALENTFSGNNVTALQEFSYFFTNVGKRYGNHTVTNDNLADGKPLNYTFSRDDAVYNGVDFTQYGQVIFSGCDNITVKNSNFSLNGLHLYNVGNSTIEGNNITSKGYGLALNYGDRNNIINNYILTYNASGHALYMTSAYYNNINDNEIGTSTGVSNGVYLTASSYNTFVNNTINSANDGIDIESNAQSDYFHNITIRTVRTSSYGIHIGSSVKNHSFYGMNIITTATTSPALYIESSAINFTIQDSVLNASRVVVNDTQTASVRSGIWNFTNVTRADGSRLRIGWGRAANATLNMHWYLDVNVTDASSSPLENANVTAWDVNGNQVFSVLTDATGKIPKQTLLEYIQNGTEGVTKIYYSPHIVNVTLAGYATNSTIFNITDTLNTKLDFQLESEGGEDTCTYTSGNWNVNCADNCNIVSNVDLAGNDLIFSGAGTFNVNANITNIKSRQISRGCYVIINRGFYFG